MTRRKALPAQLPTVDRLERGRDAYLSRGAVRAQLHREPGEEREQHPRRWWTWRGHVSTLERPDGTYAKSYEALEDHRGEGPILEIVREAREYGVPRPGNYGDVFHKLYRSPAVRWSFNAMLAPAFCGGWQAALKPGPSRGYYRRYDIRSAYLWAGTLGLPDPASYRRTSRILSRAPGIYRLELAARVPGAPYPYCDRTDVLASGDDVELYSLPVARVNSGVTWTREIDLEPLLAALRRVTWWKQAGRMYWGRWAGTARVRCHTASGAAWRLPSIACNIPWAQLIVGRVRARLWTVAKDAAHVYVDSLITPHVLETGPRIGDWRLEREYPAGIYVRASGIYGPIGAGLEKMAGVAGPLRELYGAKYACDFAP